MSEPGKHPQEILDAIAADRQRAQRALSPDLRVLYGAWGAAWVLGFTAAFLGYVPSGAPLLPLPVALAIAGAALVAAILVTAIHAARRGGGVRGPSNTQGAIFGNAFTVAFLLVGVLGWRLIVSGAAVETMIAYWTVACCLVIGALGLIGAAIWNDRGQVVFSAWVLALGFIAAWIPAPQLLLVGTVGGLGFLVIALLAAVRPALVTGPLMRHA